MSVKTISVIVALVAARRPIASHGIVQYKIDATGYFLDREWLAKATPWHPHDHTGLDHIANIVTAAANVINITG